MRRWDQWRGGEEREWREVWGRAERMRVCEGWVTEDIPV